MTVSIKFPCGCEINETSVLAMCVMHVVELREASLAESKAVQALHRQFLEAVEQAILQRR